MSESSVRVRSPFKNIEIKEINLHVTVENLRALRSSYFLEGPLTVQYTVNLCSVSSCFVSGTV